MNNLSLRKALPLVVALVASVIPAFADSYYDRRVSLFDSLPVGDHDIVFLGNSLTDGGEFAELFDMPNVLNRGISSDVIEGVAARTEQVTKGRPAKIFLLIGINDVSHHLTVDQLASRYRNLVMKIRRESPRTELYIQSVMPIDNSFGRYKNLKGKEQVILDLNRRLKAIAAESGAGYIDLWPALADPRGRLRKGFTNDGLHLTGAGYDAWRDAVARWVRQ